MQKKRSNILFFIFITCLVAVFFIVKDKGYLSADDSGYLISKKIASLEGESYLLLIKNNGDQKEFEISYKTGFFSNKNLKLTGFEEDIKECQDQPVDLGKTGRAICLIGDTGVHSQNIQFIRKAGTGELEVIPFIRGENKTDNLTSDLPKFIKKDFNNDGILDLAVENRNYEADPLHDAIREIYLGSAVGFIFDRAENIQYDIDI